MCFYHDGDYDWLARFHESNTTVAEKAVKCLECFNPIRAGVPYTHIEMREWEECKVCDPETRAEASDYDSSSNSDEPVEPCEEGKCDYGESDYHRICEECSKFLNAIQRVEEEDGCTGAEARPAYGQLREAMWESDHAQDYLNRARADYPELAMSGYLDEFYELTREYDTLFVGHWCIGGALDDDDFEPTHEFGGEG